MRRVINVSEWQYVKPGDEVDLASVGTILVWAATGSQITWEDSQSTARLLSGPMLYSVKSGLLTNTGTTGCWYKVVA